jgi:alpha-galactosidase
MTQWRLDTFDQTIVLSSTNDNLPCVIYWGASLPANENITVLAEVATKDPGRATLDASPEMSVLPEPSKNFSGQPGCRIRSLSGDLLDTNFVFLSSENSENSLSLNYKDVTLKLNYTVTITAFDDSNMFSFVAKIDSQNSIFMDWLAAPVLPAPHNSTEMIDYGGQWCGEFQRQVSLWTTGAHLRESRLGRTGHDHFPGLLIPTIGSSENSGSCYGFHYAWSGGHRMIAEQLSDGRRQVQFGHAEQSELSSAKSFETAPLFACHSSNGIGGVAQSFRKHASLFVLKIPDTNKYRPVNYNCWEAVYFDHDIEQLKEIASLAAEIGAERFVLDDGWFKGRNDDRTSLGDWQVDRRKYPQGLHPLISHIHSLGMSFGLWLEPEMINPDSDLYRQHPDWVMGHKDQLLGRHQMVLNMSLPEVGEYLFEQISTLLNEYPIEYIKWDHNRVLPYPDAEQTRRVYDLLRRIRESKPKLEIESCASGGGRIDFGILRHTQRVWLSDSNDAIERLRIQHEAILWLPAYITGSHVGPQICHTSGRVLPLAFRAWVAAQRHMGFEMDPRELTPQDTTKLKQIISWWKDNRQWMKNATVLRLPSTDKSIIAEIQINTQTGHFVVFAGQHSVSLFSSPVPLALAGLEPQSMYSVFLYNNDETDSLSKTDDALFHKALSLSGQFLMNHGLQLPKSYPAHMFVIEGEKVA